MTKSAPLCESFKIRGNLLAMAMLSPDSGKHNQPASFSPLPEADESAQSASLGSVLTSCLDMLKIEDPSVRKMAVEFVGSLSLATVNAYGKWITAIKALADSCAASGRIFSQSEMCDFLTVVAKRV